MSGLRRIATSSIFGLIVLPVAAAMGVFLKCQGADLLPQGIIGLELAFTEGDATRIVGAWSGAKHDVAVKQVLFDYIFIVGYAGSLVFICLNAADHARRRGHAGLAQAAECAALGALAAGVLDCIENAGLLLTLAQPISGAIVLITSLAASVKFALLICAVIIAPIAAFWPVQRGAIRQ